MANYALLVGYTTEQRPIFISEKDKSLLTVNPIEALQKNSMLEIRNIVNNNVFSTPVTIVGLYSKKNGYEMQIKQEPIKKVLIETFNG